MNILEPTNQNTRTKHRIYTSDDDDDSNSSSDFDHDHNSSYNSASESESKAEYYRQKRAEFVAAGPTLSDPCDSTKDIMLIKEQKWELYVLTISDSNL